MKNIPRVLLVEDEPAIAELVAVNLRHNGFQPIWAEDGDAAQDIDRLDALVRGYRRWAWLAHFRV